jgi:hypothetical protein
LILDIIAHPGPELELWNANSQNSRTVHSNPKQTSTSTPVPSSPTLFAELVDAGVQPDGCINRAQQQFINVVGNSDAADFETSLSDFFVWGSQLEREVNGFGTDEKTSRKSSQPQENFSVEVADHLSASFDEEFGDDAEWVSIALAVEAKVMAKSDTRFPGRQPGVSAPTEAQPAATGVATLNSNSKRLRDSAAEDVIPASASDPFVHRRLKRLRRSPTEEVKAPSDSDEFDDSDLEDWFRDALAAEAQLPKA